jgi:hypothetical protein
MIIENEQMQTEGEARAVINMDQAAHVYEKIDDTKRCELISKVLLILLLILFCKMIIGAKRRQVTQASCH